MSIFSGQSVLVTGSCGTVGSELVRQLLAMPDGPKEVIGLDNNESELFFQDQRYLSDGRAHFFLCDLRDHESLNRLTRGIDVIFHAAALKHVIMCERSPMDAVNTNILGVQNIVSAAEANGVKRVIFTSSDKAVNPTNVMGTSKLMGERLITAANSRLRDSRTVFASTRFGNVLGSSGSVLPIFRRQIEAGGPVTLTDRNMTRFVMSVEQSVELVLSTAGLARGGEVFITKMEILRIADLAEAMVEMLAADYGHRPEDIKIVEIGPKPGEKLYEELMSDEECRRTVELDRFFVVKPAFSGVFSQIDYSYGDMAEKPVDAPYVSSTRPAMNKEEIKHFLKTVAAFDLDAKRPPSPASRYWPGDKEEYKK